ncbi:MAG: TonB-dependent receptor [Lacibacter sp.]
MYSLYRVCVVLLFALTAQQLSAQTIIKGKLIDSLSKEPVQGATIRCTTVNCNCSCSSNAAGEFTMHCKSNCSELAVTSIGYSNHIFKPTQGDAFVLLTPSVSLLQDIVVSANRGEAVKRSLAPVAISTLSNRIIQDAKPITIDQVLNKISGVNMVSLGNEQHQISIRQPMTTKSLFLYLEDGIPVRTTGLFNHNALLEINMSSVKSIEVIKGPSSSLYGSEAIGGVVNFISIAPTAVPVLKLSVQGNNIGYKRSDLITSFQKGKWGLALSGYYADKQNGYLEYSDFRKGTATARIDYRFSDKTVLSNSATWLNYYSDMSGGIDSIMFASKTFKNLQTFTYRKVNAFRYHSTLTHQWSEQSKTTVTVLYRDNSIGQNPAYRVKDDYKKVGAVYAGKKDLAHGEINESSFNSYSFIAQHKQNFNWKKAVLIGGVNTDLSPSTYTANYIRIKKDTVSKKYVSYQNTDSVLTNYATKLNNYAAFASFEFSPLEKLRIVASLRYDLFQYKFNNHLKPSAFSGSPDTLNTFKRISPKVGFTYNFNNNVGIYANYSEGFVPPQVTEMYTGVKVPRLDASVFYNYEAGGWIALLKNKLSADVSVYNLIGTNEIISVKLDDGSFANQNAGKTQHRGVELGINANPVKDVTLRFSGAYSKHEFVSFVEKGVSYNGYQMNNAPNWIWNTELWYKPSFVKGLRVGVEWQHAGEYFADPKNTATYEGYDVVHVRAGYRIKNFELWANVMNVTNRYYSYITSKSSFGYSYQLAEPRHLNMGVSFDFAQIKKRK